MRRLSWHWTWCRTLRATQTPKARWKWHRTGLFGLTSTTANSTSPSDTTASTRLRWVPPLHSKPPWKPCCSSANTTLLDTNSFSASLIDSTRTLSRSGNWLTSMRLHAFIETWESGLKWSKTMRWSHWRTSPSSWSRMASGMWALKRAMWVHCRSRLCVWSGNAKWVWISTWASRGSRSKR